jgi:predicted dehydrogenase
MSGTFSRRDFVKSGSAVTAAVLAGAPMVHAGGQDTITAGVIGCGGRGTGAMENLLESSPNVRITAMGDMFPDRIKNSFNQLKKSGKDGFKVTEDALFTGIDAYKKVLDSGVNMVILATPPGFRPYHFKAAIDAGKHVFFEKPVAVDPVGVRMVIEAGKVAKEKKLAVVAGTQRRHQKEYIETIQRIHDGAIGDIVAARAYWNGNKPWSRKREPGQDDLTYQLKNWYNFPWLCGDHIVEQHIHNLDVIQWALRANPVNCVAVGGRQSYIEEEHGVIYDHFGVDYVYPNDVHVMSMCRHWPNSPGNVSEAVVGTKGKSNCSNSIDIFGGEKWRAQGGGKNPYVQEHTDLVASIRAGAPLNEAEQVANSTAVAIMGREAAYTGQVIKWDEFMKSDLRLMPENVTNETVPPAKVPRPGKKA